VYGGLPNNYNPRPEGHMKEPTFLERYLAWLKRMDDIRRPLASFPCPHCSIKLKTIIPDRVDIHDSAKVCPFCLAQFTCITNKSGEVNTILHHEGEKAEA